MFAPDGPGVDAEDGTLSYNATTTDPNALTLITPAHSTLSNPAKRQRIAHLFPTAHRFD
jgi:hypothetical protein